MMVLKSAQLHSIYPILLYKVKVMTSQKWKVVASCTDLDVC